MAGIIKIATIEAIAGRMDGRVIIEILSMGAILLR
jgi:hypothetical protein